MTTVPGSNLLNTALTLIGRQTFFYYKFLARSVNPNGQDVAVYEPPLKLYASIQPVPRVLYAEYGLDLQKHYIMLYASLNVLDISRDVSGDIIMYRGQLFQCLSDTKWFKQDGWGNVICAQIPNQSLIETVTSPKAGNYVTGHTLSFVVEFSLPISLVGAPALDILIGSVSRQAIYVSGTQKMLFSYMVTSGDSGSIALPVVAPATLPSLDMTNANIITAGADKTPANVTFVMPNMNGITANA